MVLSKAFLSHSSNDKAFVEAVAKRLGRQQVQFDKWAFEVGRDFFQAISQSLDASAVFCLFASKSSIASFWVKFEINHAYSLLRNKVIRSALVFIIDPDLKPADLPSWMQKSLIKTTTSANAAANAIQHHLNTLNGVQQAELYFGRNSLQTEFVQKLLPASASKPPHIFVLSGLEGVGRRTFLRHSIKDTLSMSLGPVFHLRRTDGFDVLHIALVSELGDAESVKGLATQIANFRKQSLDEKADALAAMFSRVCEDNVVPCILDDGALLESSSSYKAEAIALFKSLEKYPATILGVIHTHRPRMSDDDFRSYGACYERVTPLDDTASRQLLTKRLQLAKLEVEVSDVDVLLPYLGGYPPAINLAVGLIRDYGLPLLLADKSTLVNFQVQTFGDVLAKLNLSDEQWAVLRILAAGLSMPLQALASALDQETESLAPHLMRLVDLNLVLVSNSVFSIAYPIRFAVHATKGTLSPEEFNRIGTNLKELFWDTSDVLPSYDVIESTITSLLRSNDPDLKDFAGLVVPSLLFRAAKDSYEQWGHTNWEKALVLLRKLLLIDPQHRGGLVLLLKIQVKMVSWQDAEKTLREIQALKLSERFALEGYFFWKQRKYQRAINLYKTALSTGERAVEIYHGLASCLFQLGNTDEAAKYIREGLSNRARHNGLLLDLAAKMAISQGDFTSAAEYIEQLKRLNAMTDYHHRAATLFVAKKMPAEALPHARAALSGSRGRYEIDSVLISILTDLREFGEADELLSSLERNDRTSGIRKDVRLGLRVKLLVRQGEWKAAEAFWDALSDKESNVQKALRIELLERKLSDRGLTEVAKRTALEELTILTSEINKSAGTPTITDEDDEVLLEA